MSMISSALLGAAAGYMVGGRHGALIGAAAGAVFLKNIPDLGLSGDRKMRPTDGACPDGYHLGSAGHWCHRDRTQSRHSASSGNEVSDPQSAFSSSYNLSWDPSSGLYAHAAEGGNSLWVAGNHNF